MIYYKLNVLEALASAGYTSYRMRKEKILGDSSINRLRHSEPVSIDTLDLICSILKKQPGDIIGYKTE